jgi:hypothetical protein
MDDTDLTDDQLAQLTQLGIVPGKQDNLNQQMKLAMALRGTAMPGMNGGFGSRVQTAPNPLQYLSSGLQQVMGARQMKKIQGQQSDLLNQQAAGRLMMAKLLRGKNVPPATLPTGPQDEDPGDQ